MLDGVAERAGGGRVSVYRVLLGLPVRGRVADRIRRELGIIRGEVDGTHGTKRRAVK
jgi:hypothetical protein